MSDSFNFDGMEGDFDVTKIAFEAMASLMAPLFKALTKQGLSGQEAAALTAAYWAQNMPVEPEEPQDGS